MTGRKSAARRSSRPGTKAKEVIVWIESPEVDLRVPDGKFVGKPLRLTSWQKKIIRGIYDRPTRRAIISVGRKNAKTSLAAILLLVHLCGPKARPNSELYSSALSRDQAAIIFRLAGGAKSRPDPHSPHAIR